MTDRDNPEYICPGCAAHGMSEDCYHGPLDWVLAEAMLAGVARLHPEPTRNEGPTPWDFVDDAEAVRDHVGEPPYSLTFTHPGGDWASVGLVNGRYLIGLPDEEGDSPTQYICDLTELIGPQAGQPRDKP